MKRGKKEEMAAILITFCFLAIRERNWALTESYARQSLKLSEEAKSDSTSAPALHYLGLVALYRGEYQQASSHLEACVAQYRNRRDWQNIAKSLEDLALARLYQGTTEGIAALLGESLSLLVKMRDTNAMSWAFSGAAALAALQHQLERAARLYGASRGLRETNSKLSLALDDCPGFNQSVVATRARLGDAKYEEAWQAGYAMPLDAAVAYFLRGLDPLQPIHRSGRKTIRRQTL